MQATRLFAATLIAAACTGAFAQKANGTPAPDVATIDQAKAVNGNVTSGATPASSRSRARSWRACR